MLKMNSKNMRLLAILAVALTVLIAYGQTLGMYFWQDDSALIFKLQHPLEAAGSYGQGIIGEGPYKYLITPFVPFFPFFGLNPFGYFLVGLFAYFISTAAFYLFSSQLFQSKKGGFISTLIFAAGYIGSDTMFRISNSWQTNFGLTLALLSFWAYVKFFKDRLRLLFYAASLLFFYLAVEFVYVRSHSLVVPVLALDLLFTFSAFRLAKMPGLVLRQVPFWFLFYTRYLGETMGSSGLKSVLKDLLDGKVEVLASFFATLGNSIVPNVLQAKFLKSTGSHEQVILFLLFTVCSLFLLGVLSTGRRVKLITVILLSGAFLLNKSFMGKDLFWYRSPADFIAGGLGLYIPILVLSLAVTFWKDMKNLSLVLFFGLIFLASQILGYFIQYQDAIFFTTHRYLSYSFAGYSLILGTVFLGLLEKQKKIALLASLPLVGVLLTNLYLGLSYQNKFIAEVSRPTSQFYKDLKTNVPGIRKGAVFHFDIDSRNFYQQQFRNFFSVGSMPESTALAIYYGVDRYDLSLVEDFDELLYKLSTKQAEIDNIYNFYYGASGLVSTTETVRDLFKNGSTPEILDSEQNAVKTSPLTPMLLTIKAQVVPEISKITYPYSPSGQKSGQYTFSEKQKMLSYLLSRDGYFKNVVAKSLSEWKFQEVFNVTDNNLSTSWRGHRIYWHDNRHEQLTLDLGLNREVGEVVWTNWTHTLTPTRYTIDLSEDGENWTTVKKVPDGPERRDGEVVEEKFEKTKARYVRMDIKATLSNDAPALKEIEVVDAALSDVDVQKALAFVNNPFDYVQNEEEMGLILSRVPTLLNIAVEWETDRSADSREVAVGSFSKLNTYEFILPPGGTKFKNIKVGVPNAPVKLEVQSATLQNLSLKEIENKGLIKTFKEN